MRGHPCRTDRRRPLLVVLCILAVIATACGAAAAGDRGRDPERAVRLTPFAGCDAFAREVRRRALADVSTYGPLAPDALERGVDLAAEAAGPATAPVGAFSGTNVQEEGVDEPDVVKTDGRHLYTLTGDGLRVVDVRGQRPHVTAALRFDDGVPRDLFLHGTRLLVLGDDALVVEPAPGPLLDDGARPLPPITTTRSRLWAIDVADPRHPVTTSTLAVEGVLRTARLIDGTAHVVIRSTPTPAGLATPPDDLTDPGRDPRTGRLIQASVAQDWLPQVAVDGGPPRPLVGCADVHRVAGGWGAGMVSVLSLDVGRPSLDADRVDAVLGAADTVYADRDTLYVTTSRWPQVPPLEPLPLDPLLEPLPLDPPPLEPLPPRPDVAPPDRAEEIMPPPPPRITTEVHRFDLAAGGAEYVASGSVEGTVLDQWALSEHDDDLRIATTTEADATGRSRSAVTVLRREGDRLVAIGRVGDLGPGERIYAVRYAGDLGFVVTFRQIDPLYTLDLADPTAPRVLGELKIPGYSAYLHPIGDDHLLGIGQDADRDGRVTGLQVSLFDIGALHAPVRVGTIAVGPHTSSPVEHDHRALLSWPARDLVVVPVERWDANDVVVLVLEVADDGTLATRGSIRLPGGVGHPGGSVRTIVIGERLVTVTPGAAVISDLETLRRVGVTLW